LKIFSLPKLSPPYPFPAVFQISRQNETVEGDRTSIPEEQIAAEGMGIKYNQEWLFETEILS
jgi:hypothetical protein